MNRPLVYSHSHSLKIKDLQIVRTRFSEIINRRGMTTMSTGKAIADHLRSWSNGTLCGTHVSMALPSNGEYGVPQGVFFSFPVSITFTPIADSTLALSTFALWYP